MARVFVTTWDMGGVSVGDLRGSLPTMMKKWLPNDLRASVYMRSTINEHIRSACTSNVILNASAALCCVQ
eukprot:53129-Eustigmatos_ZCMA.PRE.1